MFTVVHDAGAGTVDIFAGKDINRIMRDRFADVVDYMKENSFEFDDDYVIEFKDLPDSFEVDIYDDEDDATDQAIDVMLYNGYNNYHV